MLHYLKPKPGTHTHNNSSENLEHNTKVANVSDLFICRGVKTAKEQALPIQRYTDDWWRFSEKPQRAGAFWTMANGRTATYIYVYRVHIFICVCIYIQNPVCIVRFIWPHSWWCMCANAQNTKQHPANRYNLVGGAMSLCHRHTREKLHLVQWIYVIWNNRKIKNEKKNATKISGLWQKLLTV